MHKVFGFVTNHWLAKLLSLVLAVTLWAVIKRNVGSNTPASRPFSIELTQPGADGKYYIDTSTHGERKK
jgi:hypothetical protein